MTLPAGVRAAVEAATGRAILGTHRVSGGSVADALRVDLAGGDRAFLKTSATAPAGSFTAEARGLRWLGEPGVIRLPEVLAVGDGAGHDGFLLLGWIEAASPARDHDEELGRSLAALHRAGAPTLGGPADGGFLAGIPTDDRPCDDVATFWLERRIAPMFRRVEARGLATPAMRAGIDGLARTIHDRVGPAEPPARLHGDLWSGNAMTDERGRPCLVDPAAYAAHREIDLAMMQIFGGFSRRVFDAYDEAWPRAPGHRERLPVWMLVPLLVHVVLFGAGYVPNVEAALAKLR